MEKTKQFSKKQPSKSTLVLKQPINSKIPKKQIASKTIKPTSTKTNSSTNKSKQGPINQPFHPRPNRVPLTNQQINPNFLPPELRMGPIININPNNPHQIDPQRNPLGFLKNFFSGFGVDFPVEDIVRPPQNINPQSVLSNVHQHNISSDIYDPSFSSFGIDNNDTFRTNFASNFPSNLEREVFNQLLNVIQGNQWDAHHSNHPPTKSTVLQKLKKFPMSEKYCKKDDKGKLEYPNCCICINDIIKNEKTIMIPCGHMLHLKCGLLWLRKNNTCPVCRFALPGELHK